MTACCVNILIDLLMVYPAGARPLVSTADNRHEKETKQANLDGRTTEVERGNKCQDIFIHLCSQYTKYYTKVRTDVVHRIGGFVVAYALQVGSGWLSTRHPPSVPLTVILLSLYKKREVAGEVHSGRSLRTARFSLCVTLSHTLEIFPA